MQKVPRAAESGFLPDRCEAATGGARAALRLPTVPWTSAELSIGKVCRCGAELANLLARQNRVHNRPVLMASRLPKSRILAKPVWSRPGRFPD